MRFQIPNVDRAFRRQPRHAEGKAEGVTVAELADRAAEAFDPDTVPLPRAELLAVTEVDGGRPLHDLDHIQRSCRHIDSLHGRCAACGMTWAAQADAIGGAL